jgi:hypothetical protein
MIQLYVRIAAGTSGNRRILPLDSYPISILDICPMPEWVK